MSDLIRISKTQKGKVCIVDKHFFQYNLNNSTSAYNYWKCSDKTCSARIITEKENNLLVGDLLPEHEHGNKTLKRTVRDQENIVIKRMALGHRTTTKSVLTGMRPINIVYE